ncbi:TPA: site-specific integrase [Pluralibacter gergoviae]|nr:site-specific integrase [Pluralibacter gergoviae]HDS1244311.1 site-specific integrase [Pluralibacter gergoviae]HDS1249754.1 site-specific integrase [Pluralibacter gergoviae]HDS1255180.1 site-specific integrase [Pluralibacter gergoviae]HDS1260793.1 site-specific integrase [Pluralibacter gergoviae]
MSIHRRGNTWHASFYGPDGTRIRESLGTSDRRQAQELHDKRKAELWRVNRLDEKPDYTFSEACLRWLEEKADNRSIETSKSLMRFWLRHFRGVKLKEITEEKIYAAIRKSYNRNVERIDKEREASGKQARGDKKPLSQASKARLLAMIKAILRAAEREWKWLDKAPVIKISQPKNKRIRWLEFHEAQRLIDECHEPLKSVVRFALATGLRRSNIINLEWQQIDMQRKVSWINPEDSKSNRAIGVALNETACRVLREQIGNNNRFVFVHTKPAKNRNGETLPAKRKMRVDDNTAWYSALKRAGIDDFRFHDLRHTWASWLIQSGVPLSILQEMGGWESIEMVRRYAHLAPNHLTEHASKIDDIFRCSDTNQSQPDLMKVGE